jgi:hypothetical protein
MRFEFPKFTRKYEKIMLGTSNPWSMSRLSHQTGKPAYYIEDFHVSPTFNYNPEWNLGLVCSLK